MKFGMRISQAKGLFFDSEKVKRALDAATRKALSRFGAFVRTRAQSSIRKRKGPSRPGTAPHSHVGLLKRLIYFGYDPGRESVVIGPARLSSKLYAGPETLPEAEEYGGEGWAWEHAGMRQWRRKRATYPARPYMGPAFEAEKDNAPNLWANSVKP